MPYLRSEKKSSMNIEIYSRTTHYLKRSGKQRIAVAVQDSGSLTVQNKMMVKFHTSLFTATPARFIGQTAIPLPLFVSSAQSVAR
jgi:hypothetical protein